MKALNTKKLQKALSAHKAHLEEDKTWGYGLFHGETLLVEFDAIEEDVFRVQRVGGPLKGKFTRKFFYSVNDLVRFAKFANKK
jgi:hypothetical protein